MLIDDQKFFLDYITLVLKNEFYSKIDIISYIDSVIAMNSFESVEPDIVITDIYMPNVDGFQLITHFKEHANTPIVAISSSNVGLENTDNTLTIAKEVGSNYAVCKSDIAVKLPQVISEIVQGLS